MEESNDCDKYVCSLPAEYIEKAELELGETETIRDEALNQMREWIKGHPNIECCRMGNFFIRILLKITPKIQKFITDSNFLIRFLRKKHFNVDSACKMLETFLKSYQFNPKWSKNIDFADSKMQEIMDDGGTFLCLDRDHKGRRVIMLRVQNVNYRHSSADFVRFGTGLLDFLLSEEITQVNGFVLIVDALYTTFSHVTIFSLSEIYKVGQLFLHALPIRMESILVVNLPWVAVTFTELVKRVISKELKDGFNCFRTVEELQTVISPDVLPLEYGGRIPIKDMIQDTKQRLAKHSATVLHKYENFIKINFEHS